MENYIVINGKKAELTPEQLKALGLETETKSPFKREAEGTYYFIDLAGTVRENYDLLVAADDTKFNVANYCTDKKMMQQQAYRETLNRLLWRYSMEHKGNEIDWLKPCWKYCIVYNYGDKKWYVDGNIRSQIYGAPYFTTSEIANNAIREIIEPFMKEHPDFKL